MKKIITYIWLVIAIIFLGLSIFHWYQSNKEISGFQVTPRPMKNVSVAIAGASIDKPLAEFATNFNKYLKEQNTSNKYQNRLTAAGYLLSALLCLVSVALNSFWFQKKFLQ